MFMRRKRRHAPTLFVREHSSQGLEIEVVMEMEHMQHVDFRETDARDFKRALSRPDNPDPLVAREAQQMPDPAFLRPVGRRRNFIDTEQEILADMSEQIGERVKFEIGAAPLLRPIDDRKLFPLEQIGEIPEGHTVAGVFMLIVPHDRAPRVCAIGPDQG